MSDVIKGFKVFSPDWTCWGFQYEVGKTFEMVDDPECCETGFHFCEKASDCFQYYNFDPDNKVAEIEALGKIDTDGVKSCTNKIRIVREIPWNELLSIVNEGKSCTGLCNTGNYNTGNYNTGGCNTGNYNTGNRNTGDRNTGYQNTGNYNTGNRNTGDRNTGDRNTGDCNTGGCNTGYRNTGNCNTGDWNTGDCNTGDCNTGDWNTGNRNTGDCNTGDYNTGDWNTGDYNTGDWNTTSFSSGVFNIEEAKILMFNKSSEWSYMDWRNSDARYLLNQIPKNVVEWVYSKDMTDEEKSAYPTHETTGGYLKVLDESECGQIWWDSLSDKEKDIIKSIPNYDKEIFEKITGIKTE